MMECFSLRLQRPFPCGFPLSSIFCSLLSTHSLLLQELTPVDGFTQSFHDFPPFQVRLLDMFHPADLLSCSPFPPCVLSRETVASPTPMFWEFTTPAAYGPSLLAFFFFFPSFSPFFSCAPRCFFPVLFSFLLLGHRQPIGMSFFPPLSLGCALSCAHCASLFSPADS